MSDIKTNIKPALYTVDEAAETLRVSKWMIYRLLRSNELKSLTIASRRLITSDDLADFIMRQRGDYYGVDADVVTERFINAKRDDMRQRAM